MVSQECKSGYHKELSNRRRLKSTRRMLFLQIKREYWVRCWTAWLYQQLFQALWSWEQVSFSSTSFKVYEAGLKIGVAYRIISDPIWFPPDILCDPFCHLDSTFSHCIYIILKSTCLCVVIWWSPSHHTCRTLLKEVLRNQCYLYYTLFL